jgi:hypothetical protein
MTTGTKIIVAKLENIWLHFQNKCEQLLEKAEDLKKEGFERLKKLTDYFKIAACVELFLLIATIISVFTGNDLVRSVTAIGSLVGILVLTNLSSILKNLLIFLAGLATIKGKEKEYKEGLKELEVGISKAINFINYIGMALVLIAAWAAVFGPYDVREIGKLQTPVLIVTFSIFLMQFWKKETAIPRIVMIIGMVIISLFWFKQQDNEISRRVATYLNNSELGIGEGNDKANNAIVMTTCIAYSQNLDSAMSIDRLTVVRLTTNTKRNEKGLCTEVMIPDQLGNFDSRRTCWIQSDNLERNAKFYPNTSNPEFAIAKKKIDGKKIWEIYFLTDGPITIDTKSLMKKYVLITGFEDGQLLWNVPSDGAIVPYGSPCTGNPNWNRPTTTFQCFKGAMIQLFIS